MADAATISTSAPLSLACTPERRTLRGAETSRAHLLFEIDVPARSARLPLNLCLLLDRSGSMDGDALEAAKRACRNIIDRLGPEDFLSVVAFGDEADVVCPARHVAAPALLKDYIDRIGAGGRANLSDGLATACGQVASVKGAGTLNCVLLLSDGEPSAGARDAAGLVAQAGDQKARGITISTVGLGPDYPEELLSGMARRTGGRFYGVAGPDGLEAAFTQEMDALARVAVRSLRLRLSLPRGAGVRLVYGQQPLFGQRTVEAVLPDPEGGMRLRSLWEMEWTARPNAPYRAAVAELLWEDAASGRTEHKAVDIVLDFADAPGPVDADVQTEITLAHTTRALETAAQNWRTGGSAGTGAVRAEMERIQAQMSAPGRESEARRAAQAVADIDAGLSPGKAAAALVFALEQGQRRPADLS